ncbi:MAG: FGGY-family carbohydrate kinase [Candidatus Hydrogenedentales bacterium]|jgi:xylulokinase
MSYIGLDIGTTRCKAVAFDEEGRTLATSYRDYPLHFPEPGSAELDSREVCDKAVAVLAECTAACASDPPRALGISSQGEAVTPVDASGVPLANAMVSSDARPARIAREWTADFGVERLYRITGHTAHPLFTLYKLLWFREQRPDVWSRAARFHCFEDLMHARLGLEPAMSWPLAGRTMMFDVTRHAWSEDVIDAVGIDLAQLPRLAPSGTVVGEIPARVAQELGLPPGVRVIAGGHDQPCAALGAGVVEPGRAMYATGTVECICPMLPSAAFTPELFNGNLCTYDFTLPGMYTTVAFSLTGGNILQWFREQWGGVERAEAQRTGRDAYDLILETLPPVPGELMALPYFTPSGTPFFDTETPGALFGLRLQTTRGEVLRALLEGVAFEMRLNVDILAQAGVVVSDFRAVGGGSRNRRLTQLKADVLHRPITTVEVTEAGCLGMAMLARSADTGTPARDIADAWVRTGDAVEPNSARAARYDDMFSRYKQLYPAMRDLQRSFS